MSVVTATNKYQYTCNGVSKLFPFPAKIFAAADLEVWQRDLDNNDVKLVLTSDYTVASIGGSFSNGANVTFATAPTLGYTITIIRSVDVTQELDLRRGDAFTDETIENAFDKTVMVSQQIDEKIERQIVAPIGDVNPQMELPPAAERAGLVLGFDSNGDVAASIAGTPATSYTQGLLTNESRRKLLEALNTYALKGRFKGRAIKRGSLVRQSSFPDTDVNAGNWCDGYVTCYYYAGSWIIRIKSVTSTTSLTDNYEIWALVGVNASNQSKATIVRVGYDANGQMTFTLEIDNFTLDTSIAEVQCGRMKDGYFYVFQRNTGNSVGVLLVRYDPSGPSLAVRVSTSVDGAGYWSVMRSANHEAIDYTKHPTYNTKRYASVYLLRNAATWEAKQYLIEANMDTWGSESITVYANPSLGSSPFGAVAITSRIEYGIIGWDNFDSAGYYYPIMGLIAVDPTYLTLKMFTYGCDNHMSGASIWNESGPSVAVLTPDHPIYSFACAFNEMNPYSAIMGVAVCTKEESGTYDNYKIDIYKTHGLWGGDYFEKTPVTIRGGFLQGPSHKKQLAFMTGPSRMLLIACNGPTEATGDKAYEIDLRSLNEKVLTILGPNHGMSSSVVANSDTTGSGFGYFGGKLVRWSIGNGNGSFNFACVFAGPFIGLSKNTLSQSAYADIEIVDNGWLTNLDVEALYTSETVNRLDHIDGGEEVFYYDGMINDGNSQCWYMLIYEGTKACQCAGMLFKRFSEYDLRITPWAGANLIWEE